MAVAHSLDVRICIVLLFNSTQMKYTFFIIRTLFASDLLVHKN
jgi:hypothetical protein